MKQNASRLLNIEVGTFKVRGQELELALDRNKFLYDDLKEINSIKKDEAPFLQTKNVSEKNGKVILAYKIPDHYHCLKDVKFENKAIRASLAKEIMNQDILNESIYHVSLNPKNIWYYPMNHIKYAYRATDLMPFSNEHDLLTQYKALLLNVLTGAPYEALLDRPEQANQKNDVLLEQIIKAKSVSDLKQDMAGIEDFVSYQEWQNQDKNNKQAKKKLWYTVGTVAIIAVLLIGLVHKKDERRYNALMSSKNAEITQVRYIDQIKTALNKKKFKTAEGLMTKAGYSKQKIANQFMKHHAWQYVLNNEPSMLEKVIEAIYQKGDKKDILTLAMPNNSKSSLKTQLKLEKAMINYNQTTLVNQMAFVSNSKILLRMGEAFLNNNDSNDAQNIVEKLKNNGNKAEGRYLAALIDVQNKKNDVNNAQNNLNNANGIDGSKDKDKDNKVKQAQTDLDSANSALKESQTKLNKAKKALDKG
jgi:hypothetical protein